ncbi:MAG: multiprotein bridging factor aMBF1 [Candidatus Syntropharchaeales archaeon]|nr:multiprotein bridging factor aMBF1 [Candidatus Syntrophoarchaeum sp.]
MQCEMCGSEIIGKPNRILIEGSELIVCGTCLRYGKEIEDNMDKGRVSPPGLRERRRPKRSIFDNIVDELISNYGAKIREARQKRQWSSEDLAKRINEKESLIKKVEREDITPDDALVKKLESVLSIKLTEGIEEANPGRIKSGGTLTLGDIVNLRRK